MTRKKSTETPSVNSALLKVDARRHINALEVAVTAYIEDPATFQYFTEDEPNDVGRVVVKVRTLVEPPPELALVCGDVIHNLRTALDLVFQLGIADSDMVSDDSQFPMLLNAPSEKVWKSVAHGMLGLLSKEHIAEIRAMQPYADQTDNSRNVQLGMLQVLEIRDKHRLPLLTATAAARGTVGLDRPVSRVSIIHSVGAPIIINGDTELYRLKIRGGGPAPINITAIQFGIAFGHERGATVANLRQLAETVAVIIGTFAVDITRAVQAKAKHGRETEETPTRRM